ncbi:excinuclease ABC subunit UvrA [Persicobacter psychrovividus]|uniref:UvrABC system protein A n=1 Tax=Persicobacter psychrovividus TaxID=387638 RepID=A0ABN6L3S8_9BACT|nr:UvrABC system protein A [Persicobacter psychrovividus]
MSKKKESQNIDFEQLDPKSHIVIKGARVNNLKNLSVAIPRNKMIVVTGLSGSGKSSLAFDTLFAEGQRMYVESLSSYARQFLGRMEKPEVDYIRGVAPAIAIEQKVNTRNPRSTVGTSTEIYDYLKLLFARIGVTYSPVSNEVVTKDAVEDVVDQILKNEVGTRLMVLAPMLKHEERSIEDELQLLLSKGFTRVRWKGDVAFIEDLLPNVKKVKKHTDVQVLIDRIAIPETVEDELQFRIADSVQTAYFEGAGTCLLSYTDGREESFSDRFERDGILFEEPSANLFTFNNPYGACRRCEGFGSVLGVDPDLVIPNKELSIFEDAIAPWRSETMKKWKDALVSSAMDFDFPIHRPYEDLDPAHQELLWTGNKHFKGLNKFFDFLQSKTHKIQYRVMLSRYRGRTSCPDCRGTRLRKDASYVKINGKSITDVVLLPISASSEFFNNLQLTDYEMSIAKRILKEVTNRLEYLQQVGLGYLTLNRLTSTLSGGEFQRIKLATSLGSALVGSMYILDEPSIGLHPRDTQRLIGVLESLRDMGNTVIVVEHEEEVMRSADQIIDIGPDAGSHGGELMYQGSLKEMNNADTHTARYLSGKIEVPLPEFRRPWTRSVKVRGAQENNLQNIDVEFPLGVLTTVTGVSGSGKSTLIKKILYPALGKRLGTVNEETGKMKSIGGDVEAITRLEFVDQNPIGKSSRSNPVTYVKAYDAIRSLFSVQPLAKQRAYKPAHFSFNVEGGRCETCQGEGTQKIEMQFMADLHLTCESCKGQRFKQEILEVIYNDKNIADILDMTVEDSMTFFEDQKPILNKLRPLYDVGLGYIRLGQSSSSLSGGEAQRVKLAYFLGHGKSKSHEHTLFIFDEPTTGLHFHDINRLMKAINALVDQGNSAIIIEHNMEVIKCADWIIDLGPEGGAGGGQVVFAGTPEEMVKINDGYTAPYLREKLK